MRRLVTLGGLKLVDAASGAPVDGLGPKPLQVLAVLSRAGVDGMPRDQLKSLFWPESDGERSAQVFRQTLYFIRRSAGDVVRGTARLHLDSSVLQVDSLEFESLATSADQEGAIARYGGPFLDGVAVRGSAELEFWIDRQRAALARLFRELVIDTARRAPTRDPESLRRWRRATDAFPLDQEAAEGRVRAHLALGDRVGAIQFGTEYGHLLRRELDIAPAESLLTLLDEARNSTGTALPPSIPVVELSTTQATLPKRGNAGAPRVAPKDAETMLEIVPAARATRRRSRITSALTGIGAVLVAAAAIRLTVSPAIEDGTPSPLEQARLIVLPPSASTQEPAERDLAELVSRLLVVTLDGASGLRAFSIGDRALDSNVTGGASDGHVAPVEELSTHLGRSRDGVLQIRSTLRRFDSRAALVTATARGHESALHSLVDSIAIAILAARGLPANRTGVSAERSTSSLRAFREFLAAERHMRAGQHAAAVERYQEALAVDSTFALASYRLSEAADWIGKGSLMMDAVDRAYRFRARLSLHDRLMVEAGYHWRHGAIDQAELLLREVVKLYPEDAESWYQLGEVQFHSGPLRGRPIATAERAFTEAFRRDTARTEALTHLARIAGAYGDTAAIESLIARNRSRVSRDETVKLQQFSSIASRDSRYMDRLVDSLRAIGGGDVFPLAVAAAQYALNLEGAARLASLLIRAPQSDAMRRTGAFLLARIQLARGLPDSALHALATLPAAPTAWSLGQRALLLEIPGAFVLSRRELVALRDSLRLWPTLQKRRPGDASERHDNFSLIGAKFGAYALGLVSLRLGDSASARAAAASLEALGDDDEERDLAHALSRALRARLRLLRADTVGAIATLDSINPAVPLYDRAELSSFSRERYLLAQLLEATGRHGEALPWYESLAQGGVGEIAYITLALEGSARVLAKRGDGAAARAVAGRIRALRAAGGVQLR